MINKIRTCAIFLFILCNLVQVQSQEISPDLSKIDTTNEWTLFNRDFTINEGIHFDSQQGDGMLWLNGIAFSNGTIELDIKGKNEPGRSFVGIAFHGLNDSVYDGVYFRAFNFENPARKNHSVQYISHPDNPWYKLRENFPGKYESTINPVPEPEDWFHVSIEIEYPEIKVFVNQSLTPSLVVNQISSRKKGFVGFWVGNYSQGSFRNLKITPKL